MKILVVSLLRLGDIIMTTPVLNGLKSKYPNAEIHILLNSQFDKISKLLPSVDKIKLFERDEIQKGLGEYGRSFFESYDRFDDLIRDLNYEGYDLAINLTHTRLSGWVMNLILAKDKLGLTLQSDGSAHFGSDWFQFLNNTTLQHRADVFHLSDIFWYGAGLGHGSRSYSLLETEEGQRGAATATNGLEPYISVQVMTSDSKKNWGVDNYAKMISEVAQNYREYSFVILAAPSEANQVEPLLERLKSLKVKHKALYCDLETAYSVIRRSELLITGDTSIKHLGAAARVPIVEISVGSSDYRKTGVYSKNALILQSKAACAPCEHSKACPYETHLCAEKLSPECVSSAIVAYMGHNIQDLKTVAAEFSDQCQFLKTDFSIQGDWQFLDLTVPFNKSSVIKYIEKSSYKLLLHSSKQNEIVTFGSEGVQLRSLFQSLFPEREKIHWVELYKEIQSDCVSFRGQLETLVSELKLVLKSFEDESEFLRFKNRISDLCSNTEWSENFSTYIGDLRTSLLEAEKSQNKFVIVKKMREVILQLIKRAEVEARLVQSLQSQTLEGV